MEKTTIFEFWFPAIFLGIVVGILCLVAHYFAPDIHKQHIDACNAYNKIEHTNLTVEEYEAIRKESTISINIIGSK